MTWSTAEINPEITDNPGKIISRFSFSNPGSSETQTPTSCAWLETKHSHFLTSFANTSIALFDQNSGSLVHSL